MRLARRVSGCLHGRLIWSARLGREGCAGEMRNERVGFHGLVVVRWSGVLKRHRCLLDALPPVALFEALTIVRVFYVLLCECRAQRHDRGCYACLWTFLVRRIAYGVYLCDACPIIAS
jgi:hypothetical protein